jgi:hypothetical protein
MAISSFKVELADLQNYACAPGFLSHSVLFFSVNHQFWRNLYTFNTSGKQHVGQQHAVQEAGT